MPINPTNTRRTNTGTEAAGGSGKSHRLSTGSHKLINRIAYARLLYSRRRTFAHGLKRPCSPALAQS